MNIKMRIKYKAQDGWAKYSGETIEVNQTKVFHSRGTYYEVVSFDGFPELIGLLISENDVEPIEPESLETGWDKNALIAEATKWCNYAEGLEKERDELKSEWITATQDAGSMTVEIRRLKEEREQTAIEFVGLKTEYENIKELYRMECIRKSPNGQGWKEAYKRVRDNLSKEIKSTSLLKEANKNLTQTVTELLEKNEAKRKRINQLSDDLDDAREMQDRLKEDRDFNANKLAQLKSAMPKACELAPEPEVIPFDYGKVYLLGYRLSTRDGRTVENLVNLNATGLNKLTLAGTVDGTVRLWTLKGKWSGSSAPDGLDLVLIKTN